MKHVSLSTLEDRIIRPGFEEHLTPLLAYRGALTLGRAHRLWNLMVSAMEHEATRADISQRLQHNAEFSQLCGPDKPVQSLTLESFASRLKDNPKVMAEMPHLAEYIDWAFPRTFRLTKVSETSSRARSIGAGGWRTFTDRRKGKLPVPEHFAGWADRETNAELKKRFGASDYHIKRWREETGIKTRYFAPRPRETTKTLNYPFLIHDGGKPEHVMMKKIARAIPRSLPEDMRADLCQDLIVGILSGELSESDLALPMKELLTKAWADKMDSRTGFVSLDAHLPGTTLKFIDTLTDEDSIWARI
jgi:hypothetical protein